MGQYYKYNEINHLFTWPGQTRTNHLTETRKRQISELKLETDDLSLLQSQPSPDQ